MTVELLNRQVKFKISDIYFPEPRKVLSELYGEKTLEGRVLKITENDRGARFLVVQVNELQNPVIISLERIARERTEERGSAL